MTPWSCMCFMSRRCNIIKLHANANNVMLMPSSQLAAGSHGRAEAAGQQPHLAPWAPRELNALTKIESLRRMARPAHREALWPVKPPIGQPSPSPIRA